MRKQHNRFPSGGKNMSSKDSIIMLASVGTTVIRAKVITYDKIREELADYSGLEVLQVFTDV